MLLLIPAALAGGGPANVLVLHHASDPDSIQTAELYAQARQLPTGHLCGVGPGLDPAATSVDFSTFEDEIREPMEACLASLPQPDEIDILVLIRGLPYRVELPTFYASLEATLQVGHAMDGDAEIAGRAQALSGSTAYASVHNPEMLKDGDKYLDEFTVGRAYAQLYTASTYLVRSEEWPRGFTRAGAGTARGVDFSGELFLVSRLDGFDHDDARALIERGVQADGSFPEAELLCMYGADEARGARDDECAYAVDHLALAGLNGVFLDSFDSGLSGHEVAAYFTGAASMTGAIDGQTYVPGAIVDNLTSYGARSNNFFCDETGTVCPESESQTSIARFVRAGATGVHGTTEEPLNNVFPHASTLLLYTAGYSLGESFLYSQPYLYWQNILLGDPLTTPWASRPTVSWVSSAEGGPTLFQGEHPDGVGSMKAYLDGVLVGEAQGELLEIVLNEPEGSELELLVVATASPTNLVRSGWPEEAPLARPDVQGWDTLQVTVGPAAGADSADSGDSGQPADPPPEDCTGCSSSLGGAGLLGLLGLLLVRRRR